MVPSAATPCNPTTPLSEGSALSLAVQTKVAWRLHDSASCLRRGPANVLGPRTTLVSAGTDLLSTPVERGPNGHGSPAAAQPSRGRRVPPVVASVDVAAGHVVPWRVGTGLRGCGPPRRLRSPGGTTLHRSAIMLAVPHPLCSLAAAPEAHETNTDERDGSGFGHRRNSIAPHEPVPHGKAAIISTRSRLKELGSSEVDAAGATGATQCQTRHPVDELVRT